MLRHRNCPLDLSSAPHYTSSDFCVPSMRRRRNLRPSRANMRDFVGNPAAPRAAIGRFGHLPGVPIISRRRGARRRFFFPFLGASMRTRNTLHMDIWIIVGDTRPVAGRLCDRGIARIHAQPRARPQASVPGP